jgi:abequosyltransferase
MSNKSIEKNNILLSICIPTFNRVEYLSGLLDSIVGQYNNNFEICISDNASSDGTEKCVREYQKSYSFINYSRNDKNLGFDGNLLKVVAMAKGKYVWMIGDDDKIAGNGVIDNIYGELQSQNYLDFLLFDRQLCDINMNPVINGESHDKKRNDTKEYDIKTEDDIIDFFEDCKYLGHAFGFISGYVFRKSRWEEINDNFDVEAGFIHLMKSWSIISASAKVRYVNKKLINVRTGNDTIVSKVGYCFRALSDFHRISSCSNAVWDNSDKMLKATMKLVKNELDSVYKNLKNCVGMRALSPQKDWIDFYATYKSFFGPEFPYSFVNILPDFLFDILHYLVKKFKLIDNKFIVQSRKEREEYVYY